MRIAISAEGPDLDTKVGERFGTSRYLLIVDMESGEVETVMNPGASSPTHSGIQAVITVISRKPDLLLTGYLSPTAEKHLTTNGISVVKGVTGLVSEALEQYKQSVVKNHRTLPDRLHADEPFLHEQVQGVVDGGSGDSRALFSRRSQDLIGGRVRGARQYTFNDGNPLGRWLNIALSQY